MPAHLAEDSRAAPAALDVSIQQTRRQLRLRDHPRCIDHLVAEIRMFAGDALAPRRKTLALQLDQKNAPAGCHAETRLKWVSERQVDLAQMDSVYVDHLRSWGDLYSDAASVIAGLWLYVRFRLSSTSFSQTGRWPQQVSSVSVRVPLVPHRDQPASESLL